VTPEEFRRDAKQLVDWIADYLESIEQFPVASRVSPGDVRTSLPASPPASPESFEAVMADMDAVVVPGLTHWQHPLFFAYFPSNVSYPSILGELAAAGLGVNGMLWATSPAATELETLMCDWMVELLGLPERFRSEGGGGGVIQGTASEATLCAILAARHRARRRDLDADLVAYATPHTHSALEKGLRIAGVERLRILDVDATFAMRPDALAQALAADCAAGLTPFLVCATAGTTSSLAFDPVAAIGPVCADAGAWLHVDGAMAGIAGLCPELRWVHDGLENADSYCTNPHKWMGVNFDCDLMYVADRRSLVDALSILPEFLRSAESDAGRVVDYRDWGIPLGRRFRALKLWFTLRLDGIETIRAMIRHHVELASELATWVDADDRFKLAAPPSLNLVCLRHRDGDAATEALIEGAKASGQALFTRTVLDGRSVLRFCIGNRSTERHHVVAAWKLLAQLA
jgi:aromatic-L-amino-acid decarboxylase